MVSRTAVVTAVALLLLLSSCGEDPFFPGQWQQVTREGFTLAWRVAGPDLEVELTGLTEGWVAVGFDATLGMHDANIIVCWVSGGAFARDDFGVSADTHESDSSLLGGTQDVTVEEGSESGGSTTVRFTMPLDSGDTWDNVLEEGQSCNVVLARGTSDDPDSGYSFMTQTTITI